MTLFLNFAMSCVCGRLTWRSEVADVGEGFIQFRNRQYAVDMPWRNATVRWRNTQIYPFEWEDRPHVQGSGALHCVARSGCPYHHAYRFTRLSRWNLHLAL